MMTSMRLFQRNGIYYVEFRRGKWQSLRTRDRKKAKAIFKEIEREWLRGRLFKLDTNRKITLAEFTKEYLEHRGSMSPHTQRHDRNALKYLAAALGGNTPMSLINTKRIDDFKAICLARGAKPVSVNAYLRHIKSALNTALEWEQIKKVPKIKLLPVNRKQYKILTPAEIDEFIAAAEKHKPDLHHLLVFYLWTGARRTEALRLTWSDVHLDAPMPNAVLRDTKGRADRTVPLMPPVVAMLREIRRDLGSVFVQIHPDTVSDWFRELSKKCGIKARPHDFRHAAATYMIVAGMSPAIVQEILGHAQLSTTQIYVHLIKDHLYKEMEKLKFE
jgi:integrase